jgi:ribonuclease P protein subunit RPR2
LARTNRLPCPTIWLPGCFSRFPIDFLGLALHSGNQVWKFAHPAIQPTPCTMAKGKAGAVANRALYSRISFLQQAAAYLATCPSSQQQSEHSSAPTAAAPSEHGVHGVQGMARRLATDMRSVSLKMRIRLSPAVKQTFCKFCNSVLIDGKTCTSVVENKSKDAKKPWADVLVRKCHACGKERRYPVSAPKQKRRTQRGHAAEPPAQPPQAQRQSQNG